MINVYLINVSGISWARDTWNSGNGFHTDAKGEIFSLFLSFYTPLPPSQFADLLYVFFLCFCHKMKQLHLTHLFINQKWTYNIKQASWISLSLMLSISSHIELVLALNIKQCIRWHNYCYGLHWRKFATENVCLKTIANKDSCPFWA